MNLQKCAQFANQTVWFGKEKEDLSFTDLSCHSCPYYKPFDTLFSYLDYLVETQHRQWGSVLDAGTGSTSLKWLLQLKSAKDITAVTVSEHMMQEVKKKVSKAIKRGQKSPNPDAYEEQKVEKVEFVLGNWVNETLLEGRVFDNIVADYLIGAMDGFTPYIQDLIFTRLAKHLSKGSDDSNGQVKLSKSRLFVVGMEPYPDMAPSLAGNLVLEVARLRDACILLQRDRIYREYPMEWIIRHLERSGYEIVSKRAFPVIYGQKKLISQLGVCTSKFSKKIGSELSELQKGLKHRIELLTQRIEENYELQTGLCFGMDYVIEAALKQ